MKILQNILTTMLLVISMSMSQLHAEETQQLSKQLTSTAQIQVLDKKIVDIRDQINVLEDKGIENLSDDEFEKLDELQDLLLTTMRTKTEQQKIIIAEQNRKLKAMERTNEKIDSILGSFPSKDTEK